MSNSVANGWNVRISHIMSIFESGQDCHVVKRVVVVSIHDETVLVAPSLCESCSNVPSLRSDVSIPHVRWSMCC